ncbi:MAG: phosphate ABC transporter permease subunit PstC [Caldilineaceae bacterium]|nr:phosphate ABC transporter permease subunit PstC [Caldilineaceae bacterium]MBP8108936.1 phosphate ABC transporter permease subunit PstC [Caldilineaceae bacterium]MBP8123826.1 phosphate ABC transporter permease subunit PstC [Caldilineaceae bacterium]MBP9073875.1 phosphate ABC transporter permease subunit PstC [Caldilineaceae bacterium]
MLNQLSEKQDNGVAGPQGFDLTSRRRIGESLIQGFLFFCGAVSILTTVGILYVLGQETWLFFRRAEVTLAEFFTSTTWQPAILDFGIWPLVNATLLTSAIAMLVALPLGLMIALYLSEYASHRSRSILKPILEVLAGVPTVVYGYFALMFMTPILRNIFGRDVVDIYNTASAGIVIGILILPLVTSMSEDALTAVPRSLREAAFGLGATRLETAVWVVLPAALSGLAAAFIVAISRAIGETMVVAIAAGAGPRNFNSWAEALEGGQMFNPFKAAETMTGHIVRISGGDISYDSLDYDSLFAIGMLLFLMTLGLNIISRMVVRRFREVYE